MRFVFFDLDDTLVDAEAALRTWSLDFAAEYIPGGPAAAADVYDRAQAVATWPEFVAEARERYGITAPAERLTAQIAEAYPGKFVLGHDVECGLTKLRAAGWRLGIVTNGTTREQNAKIDSAGLRTRVDVIVDSESAGIRKPDRRVFEIAAHKLGVTLGPSGWMVGDRLDKDIVGGLAAGLRTMWITHGRTLPETAAQPHQCAASITDAIEVILASASDPA
jgi:FMN phosphatase YigB (HAD superfamily)